MQAWLLRKVGKYINFMARTFVSVIVALLVGALLYSVAVIYQARAYTVEVILVDYQHGKWRIFESEERTLTLSDRDLSQSQIEWLLKIQDPEFYRHKGIDLSTPGAGLTTISQSIVKKLYFEDFKPGFEKLEQTLVARFVANEYLDKKQQLNLFINSVYMGNKSGMLIYGFHDAARVYFSKTVSQLTDDEYLSLVAMLISPKQFNIVENPELNKERVSRIKAVISGEYVPEGLTDLYYNRT